MAHLSQEKIKLAMSLLESECTVASIAQRIGVTESCIYSLAKRYNVKRKYAVEIDSASYTNICFDCAKSLGDCPWSEWDDAKKRVRFGEVEGWTLERYTSNGVEHTRIAACPLFEEG